MKQQFMKTAFFDFDGVIVDTEPIYDIYWNEAGKRYQTGIPNFASHIKGTTLPYILEKYFSDRSEEFKEKVIRESMEFEQQMPFPPVPALCPKRKTRTSPSWYGAKAAAFSAI